MKREDISRRQLISLKILMGSQELKKVLSYDHFLFLFLLFLL